MGNLVYKCAPENADKLNCVHLDVMHEGNHRCFHCTDNGNCARLTDRQMKAAIDKLARLERMMACHHEWEIVKKDGKNIVRKCKKCGLINKKADKSGKQVP